VATRRDDQVGAVVIVVEVEDGDADPAELSLSHFCSRNLFR
jgi:hypothetical protein